MFNLLKKIKKSVKKTINHIRKMFYPTVVIKNAEKSILKKDYNKAISILENGLRYHRKNYEINSTLANLYKKNQMWKELIVCLEELSTHEKCKKNLDFFMEMLMVYNVLGRKKDSEHIYKLITVKFKEQISKDKSGYRVLTLFDNGETRIEYYKKLSHINRIIVTFDSINMIWDNPSFGFKLLEKESIDIIAVRKRRAKTYQQDLTQESFIKATENLVSIYDDKIAYGFSLGAYTSLYFASLLNCRILSISPRLSIHPLYGRPKVIGTHKFKHSEHLPYNPDISPIIVYDPINTLDNRYVNEEVLTAFPNAQLIKVKYGGHGMAPHLLKTGQLKEFVLSVLSGTTPIYNKKLRSKSSIYYRLLAARCVKHNKLEWALDLVNISLEILPTDRIGIKLKFNTLNRLNRNEESINYLKEIIKERPKILSYRNWLVDNYLLIKDIELAEYELSKAVIDFGDRKSISNRMKKIEELKLAHDHANTNSSS